MPLRWAVAGSAGLQVRRFDDDLAVYHEASASTHLLEQDLAAVFTVLANSPNRAFDEGELLTELGETAPDQAAARRLRDILDSLQASGLAESRAP
jgi:PqqD family protein of HPr-rel-A system